MKVEFRDISGAIAAVGAEVTFDFECPRGAAAGLNGGRHRWCRGLIIRGRGPSQPENRTWVWNNNREAPTFAPSINCVGCAHGYIENGAWRRA